jgi:hypothetical protein
VVAGVQAHQVVELVAARLRTLQQLRVDQPLQQGLAGRLALLQQPGRGRNVQVWTIRQTQQSKHRGGGLVDRVGTVPQALQGHVEHRADPKPRG